MEEVGMEREKASIELYIKRHINLGDFRASTKLHYVRTLNEKPNFIFEIETHEIRSKVAPSEILTRQYKIERGYGERIYISYAYGYSDRVFNDTLFRVMIPENTELEKEIEALVEQARSALAVIDDQDDLLGFINRAKSYFKSMEYP